MYCYSPADVLEGIDGMEYGKKPRTDIILTIALNFEAQAKQFLTSKSCAPDFQTYYYVPDPELSDREIREDKRSWENSQWVNEATHLIGHSDFLINQAANTILEAGSLREFIETGQIEKAVVSMANLVACGLLHLDANKDKAISALNGRPKNNGRNGGKGKKGSYSVHTNFISLLYDRLECKHLKPKEAAKKIMQCLLEDEEVLLLSEVEAAVITRIRDSHDGVNPNEIKYKITGKDQERIFTAKNIERRIRAINKR